MPRKRKEPPHESIDSILLAISRRDDIDPNTLSHYLDRLAEEWTDGAREKVLHLLRIQNASAHAAALMILSELATDFDLEELEEFVTDPTVLDVTKLALTPILKKLGSAMTDGDILEYLDDPVSALQEMQTRLLEVVSQSEMGIESILEDVVAMAVEQRLGIISWLGSSRDPRAVRLLIPLLDNQPSKIVTAVIDSLEQLGPAAAQQSIPALNSIITSSSNRTIKQHARTALGRLTMQSVPGTEASVLAEARLPQLPPYEARTSSIDSTGMQLIMLSWQRPDGLLKCVNVLYQDQWGIKDCYGVDGMNKERWDTTVNNLGERGLGSFLVSFEYARALLAEARTLNKRARHTLPIAYSVWRSFLEGEISPKKKGASTLTLLAPRPLDDDTLTLAQHGDELYQMPEFTSWFYEPLTRIAPYMSRYWDTNVFEAPRLGKGNHKRTGRKGRLSRNEANILLEALVTEALDELVDDRWRLLYETRLRRQAALFRFADREQDAAFVGAVAAVLHPNSQIAVQDQAFLRAMMRVSIEEFPLRLIATSLGIDKIDPMLVDIFGER
jgi:hypothetical protein